MSRAVIVTMVIQLARPTTIDMAASDITTRDTVDRVDNVMDGVDLVRGSTVVNYGRDERGCVRKNGQVRWDSGTLEDMSRSKNIMGGTWCDSLEVAKKTRYTLECESVECLNMQHVLRRALLRCSPAFGLRRLIESNWSCLGDRHLLIFKTIITIHHCQGYHPHHFYHYYHSDKGLQTDICSFSIHSSPLSPSTSSVSLSSPPFEGYHPHYFGPQLWAYSGWSTNPNTIYCYHFYLTKRMMIITDSNCFQLVMFGKQTSVASYSSSPHPEVFKIYKT